MAERLTTIETLPLSLTADVQWLFDTILSRRMTQIDMLASFNQRITAAGEKACSQSGLNRYVLKVRAGSVRRPGDAPSVEAQPSPVFTDIFRRALATAIGEDAVEAHETALLLLTRPASLTDGRDQTSCV